MDSQDNKKTQFQGLLEDLVLQGENEFLLGTTRFKSELKGVGLARQPGFSGFPTGEKRLPSLLGAPGLCGENKMPRLNKPPGLPGQLENDEYPGYNQENQECQ
ncbi:hypothetical protein GCK72_022860 [Caenorhabditis remanei]|uniref:Uncharacterized protein n=1 Tax=Caenorhabditis remanei TaxID=31234 RepID=A0A6A5FV62_CAERE|nr:hypothetical protein GCK72_022860 [Caenorhabditis remanei]KAF1746406.1 hypothetical protein GCK72_022860 [Caenorhabditis remanei]